MMILEKISPKHLIFGILGCILATQIVTFWFYSSQPWVGLEFVPDESLSYLEVRKVYSDSPAEKNRIKVGDRFVSLKGVGKTIKLDGSIVAEPLYFSEFEDFNLYMEKQKYFKDIFDQGKFTLVNNDGKEISITPEEKRSWKTLPFEYWYLTLFNIFGVFLGALVWSRNRHNLESKYLLLAGVSHYIFGSIFCFIISREFFLPEKIIRYLVNVESLFLNVFVLSLFVILAYYPRQLYKTWSIMFAWVVILIISANYSVQLVAIPYHIFYIQFLPIYVFGAWLGYKQWVLSHKQPVNRAAVLILIMSMLIPNGIIIFLYFLPVILQYDSLLPDLMPRIILIILFVGWAIGIAKYKLFNIEYWWFKSWLWLLSGSIVISVDLLLLNLLHISEYYTLVISIVFTGFIYFPLRQWLLNTFMPNDSQSLQDLLPEFSMVMSKSISNLDFEENWIRFLKKRYHPLNIEKTINNIESIRLSDNGLHLLIPSINSRKCYRLSGKKLASKLFSSADIKTVTALLAIARIANNTSEARQKAVLTERKRIMNDLHDTVGAKLVTLIHKAPKAEYKDDAKQALQTLREMVKLSLKSSPIPLENLLADWRAEINERAEAASIELNWQQKTTAEFFQKNIPPQTSFHLTQVIRELFTNALKHAKPKKIIISLEENQESYLKIKLSHDGNFDNPESWSNGNGTKSIKNRLSKINATLEINTKNTMLEFTIRIQV